MSDKKNFCDLTKKNIISGKRKRNEDQRNIQDLITNDTNPKQKKRLKTNIKTRENDDMVVSTYKDDKMSKDKQQVHDMYLSLANQIHGSKIMLSLEGPKFRSGHYFLKKLRGLEVFKCFEWDSETYFKHLDMIEKMDTDVKIVPAWGNINIHLKDRKVAGNLYFLDYMGSIFGSKTDDCYPLEGIDMALKNAQKAGYKQVALGFTFCKRGTTPKNHKFPRNWKIPPYLKWKGNQLSIVQQLVPYLASCNGYSQEVSQKYEYGLMCYVQFLFHAK